MRKKIVLTIAVVVVVLSISGLSQFLPSEDNSMETDTVTLDNQINIEKHGDTFNFTFNTVEKETVTINELLMKEKPLLIYFFATWCPVCDKDLQNLNTVYSSDIDRVSVLVVGFDPSENIDMIRQYKESK